MRRAIWALAGVVIVLALVLLHGAIHMKMAEKSKMIHKHKHAQMEHHVHSEDGKILWQSKKKKKEESDE